MKLDSNISQRLAVLRFPLIVGVVLMHSFSSVVYFSSGSAGVGEPSHVSLFIRQYISEVLASVSVPLFYSISGFLFFYGFQLSKKYVLEKLSRRFKTLFIPFILWNLIVLSGLAVAQSIPSLATYFSGNFYGFIRTFSLFDYFNALFGIKGAPIAFQFWFIRDLMVLVLFSPLIYIAVRGFGLFFVGPLFLLWLANIWPIYFPSTEATFFFSLGCYLGINKIDLGLGDRYFKPVLLIYIIFSLVDLITYNYQYHFNIHRLGILFGVFAAFCATQYVSEREKLKPVMATLGSASFFVFAAHQPFLMVLKKIIYKILSPDNDLLVLFLYFAIPVVVIVVCLYTYKYLARYMPFLASILSGGRVQPPEPVMRSGFATVISSESGRKL